MEKVTTYMSPQTKTSKAECLLCCLVKNLRAFENVALGEQLIRQSRVFQGKLLPQCTSTPHLTTILGWLKHHTEPCSLLLQPQLKSDSRSFPYFISLSRNCGCHAYLGNPKRTLSNRVSVFLHFYEIPSCCYVTYPKIDCFSERSFCLSLLY